MRRQSRRVGTPSGAEIAPKKSLGQNFLTDTSLARWIADQIEPDDAELVMEIGPGAGALTEHLIGRPRKLVLVEMDDRLAAEWQQRFAASDAVAVRHEDAARLDLRPLFSAGGIRVIGNLPYSAGGEILKRLLSQPTPVERAVFMLQKEVCERLAAPRESDSYGALSLLVQKDWLVEVLRAVPPSVFKPRPRVDSAVIRFTPRPAGSLPVFDRGIFDRLVRMGFSQRRKQMKNLLPDPPGGWAAMIESLGVPATVRAEELDLRQWVAAARWFEGRRHEDRGQQASELFDVVNERNEVTGQLPRGEVHARRLLHRAVHVFAINKRGEVYLQKRSHLKDVSPLKWDSSAAGHLDSGEGYAAAAIRELREELGVAAASTDLAAELPASVDTDFEFVQLHTVRHDGPVRPLPEEIDCGQWFAVEQIDAWVAARPQDFARGFVRCWRRWRE